MTVNGYRYDVVGHAGGSSASGTWSTTGNCSATLDGHAILSEHWPACGYDSRP